MEEADMISNPCTKHNGMYNHTGADKRCHLLSYIGAIFIAHKAFLNANFTSFSSFESHFNPVRESHQALLIF